MKTKSKRVIMLLELPMLNVLHVIENSIRLIEGMSYEMTITSAKDGLHMKGSLHYKGLAIDIRVFDMENPMLVLEAIKKALGVNYDVIFEIDHIHIEFDPKH